MDTENFPFEREQHIDLLKKKIIERDNRIQALYAELERSDRQIANYAEFSVARNSLIAKLNDTILQLDQKLDQAIHQRNLTAIKLAEIESATVWKISYPLRYLATEFPVIRLIIRRIVKLTWWTITGRIIQKLRERRAALVMLSAEKQQFALSQNSDKPIAPEETAYESWIRDHDTLSAEDMRLIRRQCMHLIEPPLISIVMPVYNTPEAFLREAIESVRTQLYPYWELCVCDDASPSPDVLRILEEEASKDSRIRWVRREKNGHICAATNDAIALATGEYVALMDHDDILPPHALYSVAVELMAHPETDMLFTDEDRIDDNGRRHSPYFKPGWNPELLLSQNFICHLGVYRRSLLNDIGGLREGFEGSQDYDLALRFSALAGNDRVRHLPGILYHWRLTESQSTPSFSQSQIDRCANSARRAITEYLRNRNDFHGDGALVTPSPVLASWSRVRWPLPSDPPKVSIIVPTRDRHELLAGCVEGVLNRTDYPNIELIIADNESIEPQTLALFEELKVDPRVRIFRCPGPFNYSAINNAAAREASGEILVLLNNDIDIIGGDWLSELASMAIRPEVGCVGAKLLYANDTVQHAGVVLGIGTFNSGPGVAGHFGTGEGRAEFGYFGQYVVPRDLCAVTAACLAVRRDVFEKMGGLDEKNLAVAFNDVDFCLRVYATGLHVIWTPHAELYHLESASRGAEDAPEKLERFKREGQFMRDRWSGLLDNDPFYNPVFSRWGPLFDMTRPSCPVKPWQIEKVLSSYGLDWGYKVTSMENVSDLKA
jgi:GT2 family glycosyltransferase